MTKFYAPKKPKANALSPLSPSGETLPAPMSEFMQPFRKCASVAFVLHTGHEIEARADGLDDDGEVIYGLTIDGRNFAVPIASVSYAVECL